MTTPRDSDEAEVRSLYRQLLDGWNKRDAAAYAALFDDGANVVGFDGSQMTGRSEIETTLAQIFAPHQTAPYVSKVREVRFLTPDVAILHAVVGMVPPGQNDINPAVNAIQSLVAVKRDGRWRIAVFQNTPAQFHGRPEIAQQLSRDPRQLLQR